MEDQNSTPTAEQIQATAAKIFRAETFDNVSGLFGCGDREAIRTVLCLDDEEMSQALSYTLTSYIVQDADLNTVAEFDDEDEADEHAAELKKESGEDHYVEEQAYDVEPTSYWTVSNWLGDKLAEEGELVLDTSIEKIWCRVGGNQLVSDDACFLAIAKERLASD